MKLSRQCDDQTRSATPVYLNSLNMLPFDIRHLPRDADYGPDPDRKEFHSSTENRSASIVVRNTKRMKNVPLLPTRMRALAMLPVHRSRDVKSGLLVYQKDSRRYDLPSIKFLGIHSMEAGVDFVARERLIEVFDDDRSVVYILDGDLRLLYCNKAWDEFAERNGGARLRRIDQVGHSVLDAISEPLKTFYGCAFERSLAEQQPWEHSYECSSPESYREFHMQVLPLQAPPRLVIVNSLLVETAHERIRIAPLTAVYRTAGGVISMCMHCRRTRRSDEPNIWDWVPEFLAKPPANLSHALCPTCFHYYYPRAAMERARPDDPNCR